MWYLQKHNYLLPSQFGYRYQRSTVDPLTLLEHDLNQLSKDNLVMMVYFDLAKAYGNVRQHILAHLHKIKETIIARFL